MKVSFLFLLPFLVCCASSDKQSSLEQAARQISSSQGIMAQARSLSREVMDEGRENVDFLLKKLKIASNKYRALQKRLVLLENRVSELVRQLQNREDVEITVEEDGETAFLDESPSLFEEKETSNPFLFSKKGKLPSKKREGVKRIKDQANPEDTKKKKEEISPESLFIQGQNLFIERSWEKAIEILEQYRNRHPEGSQYPSATYLMGRAFQELDMKEEAQIFFKELVAGYPESPFAKKARRHIKNP